MQQGKDLDIVVYGASGFTGKLVCEYLYIKKIPRWAMAGRSLEKLKKVLEEIQISSGRVSDIPTFVVSPDEPKSVGELASRTKVLINCVGPFHKTGEPVIKACIENKCHYADISGEPLFFLNMVRKYDEQAKKQGVCIVIGCGLDSIPWDLGVLHAMQGSSQRNYPKIASVTAYGKLIISPSVGTVMTALDTAASLTPTILIQAAEAWFGGIPEMKKSGKTLTKQLSSFIPRVPFFPHYSTVVKQWVFPVPGLIDSLVVRRTARILNASDSTAPLNFHFGQYFCAGNFLNFILITILAAMILPFVFVIAKIGFLRRTLEKVLKKNLPPGPSAEARKKHKMEIIVVAQDHNGLVVGKSKVTSTDPAYGATAMWAAESGICLTEIDSMQNHTNGKSAINEVNNVRVSGGVLTPASCKAMGFKLIKRLERTGLKFESI